MTNEHRRESESVPVASMQLMDAGLAFAQRMRAELMRNGVEDIARFMLPVWVDKDANVRIALPVEDPQHGTDVLQLIVPLDELLRATGDGLHENRYQSRLTEAAARASEADRGA